MGFNYTLEMSKNGNCMYVTSSIKVGKMRDLVKKCRESGKEVKIQPILPWLLEAVIDDFENSYEGKGFEIEKLVISSEK